MISNNISLDCINNKDCYTSKNNNFNFNVELEIKRMKNTINQIKQNYHAHTNKILTVEHNANLKVDENVFNKFKNEI